MSQHRARAGSSPDDTYGFGEDGEIVPAVTFLVRAFLRSSSKQLLSFPTEKDAPVVADTVARVRSARPKTQSKAVRTAIAEAEQIAEDFVQPRPR